MSSAFYRKPLISMLTQMSGIEQLRSAYRERRNVIEKRLREFEKVGKGKFKVLFPELVSVCSLPCPGPGDATRRSGSFRKGSC